MWSRAHVVRALRWGAVLVGSAAVVASQWEAVLALLDSLHSAYRTSVPIEIRRWVYGYVERTTGLIFDPVVYALVAGVLILERIMPARPSQATFSRGIRQDYGWFIAEKLLFIPVIAFYADVLESVYRAHLGFLTLPVASWPMWARGVCTILVGDFFSWLHHVLRHKIGVFWVFHVVHHSQRQMSFFADYRVHLVELAIAQTILFIPIHMFAMRFPANVYLLFVFVWYTRIYHANLRTNLGWLKHILVTPQSHRVHHSIERAHWDKNFGVIFSIWDRMFGTLHSNYDEYPETGVADAAFPWEGDGRRGVLRTLWAQSCYPFQVLLKRRGPRDARRWTRDVASGTVGCGRPEPMVSDGRATILAE
jgi:sterol desaturase/sphingolipid hydroxylase (fatty acid hydroxylase superfamily)